MSRRVTYRGWDFEGFVDSLPEGFRVSVEICEDRTYKMVVSKKVEGKWEDQAEVQMKSNTYLDLAKAAWTFVHERRY